MKRLILSLVLCLSLFCGNAFAADTIKYVSPAGTGDGSAPGTPDTFEDAYVELRGTDGNHTITFVEAGTYTFAADVFSWNNAGDNLTLQADTGLTSDDVIIDGENTYYTKMSFNRAGCDLTVTNLTFKNGVYTSGGGGAIAFGAGKDLTVTGCQILNNSHAATGSSSVGAGILVCDYVTGNVVITTTILDGNSCERTDNGEGSGGGMEFRHPGNLSITDCIITNNYAGTTGGGMLVKDTAGAIRLSGNTWSGNSSGTSQGGAIKFANETVKDILVDGDIFTGNTSNSAGAAIKYSNGAAGTTKNCYFGQNINANDVDGDGGAIDFGVDRDGAPSESILTNCVFVENHGGHGGAWCGTVNHNITASNNSYYGNTAAAGGHHICKEGTGTSATLKNEIFQHNAVFSTTNTSEVIYASLDATLDIQYCNIEGGADAVTNEDTYTSNLNVDPKFYNIGNDDLRLRGSSPCIDAGTDVSITHDYNGWRIPNGVAQDMGAYEFYERSYGSQHAAVTTKTAGTVLSTTESGIVRLDSTAGNISFYLPPLELSQGLPFLLHRDNGGANTITIYANEDGGTISGAASKTLAAQYSTIWFWGTADEWLSVPYTP